MGLRNWLARLSLAAALGLLAATPAAAQEAPATASFSAEQDAAIREIVRDYLTEHPEVLVEALQLYERRQKEQQAARQREAVLAHLGPLAEGGGAPILGNPDGDVLVVEFFDYRCPYCKKVAGSLREAIETDGNIKLVMKEFPILGPQSIHAARVALAAGKQGKYDAVHFALMASEGELDEAAVLAIAEGTGLDMTRLQEDMRSEEIDAALRHTYELAEALDIRGTPAFVIGDRVVPGAIDLDDLKALVAEARAASKS